MDPRVTTNIKFASTNLYIWVERGTVRVNCLDQEHNIMTLARARTQIVQSGGKNTSLETTKSPQIAFILLVD